MKQTISIIGSTGSVGKSAIEVIIRNPDELKVLFLACYANYKLLARQAKNVSAQFVVILDKSQYSKLVSECLDLGVKAKVLSGLDELYGLIKISDQKILVANNGVAALPYILAILDANNVVALANKEALVSAGHIIRDRLKLSSGDIIPVDSEHNAIYQIVHNKYNIEDINSFVITASGGPFYHYEQDLLLQVTPQDTNNHPTWNMGAEICVNSATLVNKALEVIEAHFLFNISVDKIQVMYHPQSIIHGMVNYVDGSCLIAAAYPNMQTVISHAFKGTKRLQASSDMIFNPTKLNGLTLEVISESKYKIISMARQAATSLGSYPCTLNVANEVAVASFLKGKINFTKIINVIEYCLNKAPYREIASIDDVNNNIATVSLIASQYVDLIS